MTKTPSLFDFMKMYAMAKVTPEDHAARRRLFKFQMEQLRNAPNFHQGTIVQRPRCPGRPAYAVAWDMSKGTDRAVRCVMKTAPGGGLIMVSMDEFGKTWVRPGPCDRRRGENDAQFLNRLFHHLQKAPRL